MTIQEWSEPGAALLEHVRACLTNGPPRDEHDLRKALVERFAGAAEEELVAAFADPAYPPPTRPTFEDRRSLPASWKFRDVCDGKLRKVDLLIQRRVPVELKYEPGHDSDVYRYEVLRDFHRMERIIALRKRERTFEAGAERFVVFVTNKSEYWEIPESVSLARRSLLEAFGLYEGRLLRSPYWVCYHQPSAKTRWDYVPFFLSNRYDALRWFDVPGTAFRVLLQQIRPQEATAFDEAAGQEGNG